MQVPIQCSAVWRRSNQPDWQIRCYGEQGHEGEHWYYAPSDRQNDGCWMEGSLIHKSEPVKLIDVTLPQVAALSSPTEALKLIQTLEKINGPIVIPAGKTLRLQVELIDQPVEWLE